MNKFICAAIILAFATTGFVATAHAEKDRIPDIHRAIEKLEHAQHDLVKAGDEYDGYRARAMEHIAAALKELHAADVYAHNHPQDVHHN